MWPAREKDEKVVGLLEQQSVSLMVMSSLQVPWFLCSRLCTGGGYSASLWFSWSLLQVLGFWWGLDELGLVLSTSQVLASRAVDLERSWRHFASSWFSSVKSISIGPGCFESLRSNLVDIAHVGAMVSN